ncbi:hypothetical protein NCH01_09220 [Neoasaia chiangmaiensis]|nr:hypothetical protein NCH01_09220 [Neoasaia chiangmaiensis]
MLRNEHRVATHRRLLAVIEGMHGGEPRADERCGMIHDRVHTALRQITLCRVVQMKPRPKARFLEPGQQILYGWLFFIIHQEDVALPSSANKSRERPVTA